VKGFTVLHFLAFAGALICALGSLLVADMAIVLRPRSSSARPWFERPLPMTWSALALSTFSVVLMAIWAAPRAISTGAEWFGWGSQPTSGMAIVFLVDPTMFMFGILPFHASVFLSALATLKLVAGREEPRDAPRGHTIEWLRRRRISAEGLAGLALGALFGPAVSPVVWAPRLEWSLGMPPDSALYLVLEACAIAAVFTSGGILLGALRERAGEGVRSIYPRISALTIAIALCTVPVYIVFLIRYWAL
jgi:hypothetical protein